MADDLAKLIAKVKAEPITGDVTFAPTGLIGLDWALGGGLARGRLIEFSGTESSGKSTIGLQAALHEAKQTGVPGLWLDYEYAWEPGYIAGLGGTSGAAHAGGIEELWLAQPVSIEDGMELAQTAILGGHVSSVWIDSTGVMESKEKGLATRARALAQAMPDLMRAAATGQVVVGFISQTRFVINQSPMPSFTGPKRQATGGTATKFAYSQRVEFSHRSQLKGRGSTITGAEEDMVIGRRVKAKVIKNKVAVPGRVVEFDLVDGHGFDAHRHTIELAVALGIVRRRGSYYVFPTEMFAGREDEVSLQGMQNAAALLRAADRAGRGGWLRDRVREAVAGVTTEEITGGVEGGEGSTQEEDHEP